MPRTSKKRSLSKKKMPSPKRVARNLVSTRFGAQKYGSQMSVAKLNKGQLGRTFRTKLTYAERGFTLNSGIGGTVAAHVFSANGLFDPDITGVGHQPAGFDEMMSFFDHYTVISSKIYVNFANRDGSNRNFAGIYISDNSTIETDYRVIVENGLGTYSLLDFSNGGNDTMEISVPVSTSRFLGRPDILSEDDLRGTNAANPAEQVYFIVWCAPDSNVDGADVKFSVRIEYVVQFTEPKRVAIS